MILEKVANRPKAVLGHFALNIVLILQRNLSFGYNAANTQGH